MAPPNPLPRFVYKITPSAPPNPIPAEYPLSELDQDDGFVHLSTNVQIPTTADLFFASAPSIWILRLPLARFAHATRWDDEVGPGFPHLHGNFAKDDVESVREFTKKEGELWKDVLKAAAEEGWLV